MGIGENRALGGDEEVAAQCHLQSAGEHRAVDRADDRLVHLGCLANAALLLKLLEVHRAEPLRLLEVDTGAERRVGAGEHHRPHRRVVVGLA